MNGSALYRSRFYQIKLEQVKICEGQSGLNY